jgi:HD-GYP domain-containing protein (c-di-GMP phosphodiesterase class II)
MVTLSLKNKPRSKSLIIALLLLACLLPLWWQISLWYQQRLLVEMRARITNTLAIRANYLSMAINQRLAIVKGLAAFADRNIGSNGRIDAVTFAAVASGLSRVATGVRTIALAPGGIMLYIYPVEGNETLAGQDLIQDGRPTFRADVQRAIRTRRITVSGPYTLRPKGLQLVARQAVYSGETLWGLVSVDCDITPAFTEAALDDPSDGIDLTIEDRTGHLLAGRKAVLAANPIVSKVDLPDGAWKLSAIPAGGWQAAIEQPLTEFRVVTIPIALLLTILAYLLISYHAKLKQTVAERTGELQRSLANHRDEADSLTRTLGNLRRAMGATLEMQARAVEMKDPYATGHQHRVADLARTIAMEMGYRDEMIDGIRMAAIVHDIGKLLLPAEILNKQAPLTEIEWIQIKKHPQAGYDILKDIDFPWPIARLVWQHHERLDGSGYPLGLSGEEILPEARILAVADVVEAMASHRAYRPAPGLEKAFEEITARRGVLYDAAVVDACIRIFREKDFRLA